MAAMFCLSSYYRKKRIHCKLRPFCTFCESFNSIAIVSRDKKRAQTKNIVSASQLIAKDVNGIGILMVVVRHGSGNMHYVCGDRHSAQS